MKVHTVIIVFIAISTIILATDNAIHTTVAVRSYTPITKNTTNTSNATVTTITITSYTTVTSHIFQTYTSIQVVTLNWGVDPNIAITFIIITGVTALIIGYILGYRTKREIRREEVVSKPKIEKPPAKPRKSK